MANDRRSRLRASARGRADGGKRPYESIDEDLIAAVQAAESNESQVQKLNLEQGVLIGRFKLTGTGLVIPQDVTEDEIDQLGNALSKIEDSRQWWWGDFALAQLPENADQYQTSEIYERLSERYGIDKNSLKQYVFVCRAYPALTRVNAVSFTHHRQVASHDDRAELLQWAEETGASIRKLRDRARIYDLISGRDDRDELLHQVDLHDADASQVEAWIAELDHPQVRPTDDTSITEDSWLFSSKRRPSPRRMQKLYELAQNGDEDAKMSLLTEIDNARRWFDALEKSVND